MHRVTVCLLLTTVGVLHAASYAPQPCCMPDQVEFDVGESVGYSEHQTSGLVQLRGWGAVDFKKKMIFFKEQIFTRGRVSNMSIIEDLESQLMYQIDEEKHTCTKSKLPSSEMAMQCLPDDATYVESMKFGLGSTISGDAWMFNFKDEASRTDLNVYIVMQTSASNKLQCVPITEGISGRMGETGVFVGASFFNVKDSISDPSVFNIPEICKKDSVPLVSSLSGSAFQNYMVKKYQKLL